GVDNNGGVFSPFDPRAGIGGLNAIGGLNPTGLQYPLIQRALEQFETDEAEIDTAPTLVSLIPGRVVNEDDLGGGGGNDSIVAAKEFEPFPSHILNGLNDAVGNLNWTSFDYPYETGNDPFDTKDHEDGSAQQPGFPDNAAGVDQDRE